MRCIIVENGLRIERAPVYVIFWRSRITGAEGHGSRAFPEAEAQRYADGNQAKEDRRADGGSLTFWIEPF